MSKFKVGDKVYILDEMSGNFGSVGVVIEANRVKELRKGYNNKVNFKGDIPEVFDDKHLRHLTPLEEAML